MLCDGPETSESITDLLTEKSYSPGKVLPYIIFVADIADVVCGAKIFLWSNFAPHDNFLCGAILLLLHMTNLAPHDKFAMCAVSLCFHDLFCFAISLCVEKNINPKILSVEQN